MAQFLDPERTAQQIQLQDAKVKLQGLEKKIQQSVSNAEAKEGYRNWHQRQDFLTSLTTIEANDLVANFSKWIDIAGVSFLDDIKFGSTRNV